MNFKELQTKIIELTKRNISQGEIANALNVSRQNVSQRLKNNSPVNTDEIIKIEKAFNIDIYDILDLKIGVKDAVEYVRSHISESEVEKNEKNFRKWENKNFPNDTQDEKCNVSIRNDDYIAVPYYPDLVASCGAGGFALETNPNSDFFPISTKYGLNIRNKYFIINAFGDSMEPTIYDRQYVIFEEWREKQIVDNRIYFFCYEDKLFIKRLAYNIDEIVAMSDNKKYDKKIISKNDINNVIIYGRFKGLIENE